MALIELWSVGLSIKPRFGKHERRWNRHLTIVAKVIDRFGATHIRENAIVNDGLVDHRLRYEPARFAQEIHHASLLQHGA